MCNHHNSLEEIWTNSKDPVLKIVALSHSFIKIQCCKQQYCVITNNDNTCARCASALQKLSDLSCLLVLSPETSLWILVAAPRILPPVHSSGPLIILTTHAMVCVRLLFCFIYLNKFFWTTLAERRVKTASGAACLADKYFLIHKTQCEYFGKPEGCRGDGKLRGYCEVSR